jgi:crotonobetaine/carnitine-CoA ligase
MNGQSGPGTISKLVATRASEQPGREVVRIDETPVTYLEIDRQADRMAAAFHEAGLGRGDMVATVLSNRPEALFLWVGFVRIGAVEVPVNTALKGDLLVEVIQGAGCRMVVVEEEFAPLLREVMTRLPAVERVVVVGVDRVGLEATTLEDLVDGATGDAPVVDVDPDDLTVILFTSGTSGRSKGVELSHTANLRLARTIVDHAGIRSGDVLLTVFPLFHVAARCVSVLAAMLADAEVVIRRRYSATRFWDICRDQGITAIHYLGSMPMTLHKQPPRADDPDTPVRLAYGAGLAAGIWEDFEERFGLVAYELYGSTEQGATAMSTSGARRVGSCGRPVSDVDLEIHDEDDRCLPPGQAGEIVVRPGQPGIFFSGYHGMAEATVESWRNLWFHTGDQGYLDEDGFLYFMGRLKDAIRRRGENISAWEVERALLTHPAIGDGAALGVPSELGEEELLVAVVPESGSSLDPRSVVAHCEQLLPAYAVPRYVRVLSELPRTASDRVKKAELRDEGVTADTHDREET